MFQVFGVLKYDEYRICRIHSIHDKKQKRSLQTDWIKASYQRQQNDEIFNEDNKQIYRDQKEIRKPTDRRDLQDGGGPRRGDHLPPHKYIRNTSTCGTTPTAHLPNTGRRPQTSQKARNSPHTWVGQKKKEKTETKEQKWDLHLWEVAVKEEKFLHTRKPLHWRRWGWRGEASEPQRRAQQQGCRGQSGEIPAQRTGGNQHSPA